MHNSKRDFESGIKCIDGRQIINQNLMSIIKVLIFIYHADGHG
jgi:hypothetical protein